MNAGATAIEYQRQARYGYPGARSRIVRNAGCACGMRRNAGCACGQNAGANPASSVVQSAQDIAAEREKQNVLRLGVNEAIETGGTGQSTQTMGGGTFLLLGVAALAAWQLSKGRRR